jgi:hypothetical protein
MTRSMLRSIETIFFNTGGSTYSDDHIISEIVSRIVPQSSGLEAGIVSRSFDRNSSYTIGPDHVELSVRTELDT